MDTEYTKSANEFNAFPVWLRSDTESAEHKAEEEKKRRETSSKERQGEDKTKNAPSFGARLASAWSNLKNKRKRKEGGGESEAKVRTKDSTVESQLNEFVELIRLVNVRKCRLNKYLIDVATVSDEKFLTMRNLVKKRFYSALFIKEIAFKLFRFLLSLF